MLRTVSGSRCCGVGDPVACGMSCFPGLYAAFALVPMSVSVGFPFFGVSMRGFAGLGTAFALMPMIGAIGLPCTRVNMSGFVNFYTAFAFMPVLISIGLPVAGIAMCMIAAGCRDRNGFNYALADSAFLMFRTVGGSRCCCIDDPVACGMSFLTVLDHRAAAINFAYFPMIICIRLPIAVCNMGMLLTGMFI